MVRPNLLPPACELKKILRVPIDRGKDGMLYACAFSPDGRVIAAGGWTVRNWDNSCSIYFLDAASGRMIRRIPGL
ncbi:MAG: WD40 repeat domain-containing protein, partial [Pirellulaceae bacterium]